MLAAPARYVEGLPTPDRCLVMGVVNVTPDSFSDGGRWFESTAALDHGLELVDAGADLIDVGGESTRPGAERPTLDEERARVLPVVAALAKADAVVTVDTMRASVARAAVEAGAAAVNDVSGGLADPEMLPTVVALGVPYLAMHWRGHATTMQDRAAYADVVAEVRAELHARAAAARAAGLPTQRLALDPGLGFAKNPDHNWRVLSALESFHELGHPLLVGASRKSFLGALLADADGEARPATERDDASAAVSALCAAGGVWCVRVHDVRRSLDAVKVASRWAREVLSGRHATDGDAMKQQTGTSPPDRLALRGLRAHGHHGVLDTERVHGQEFVVDVVLGLDTRPAAASDDLTATVDYADLTERLAAAVSTQPVALIETLAQRLADICLGQPSVAEVDVTVHKPEAPLPVPVSEVSVTIHRSRDE